MPTVSLTQRSIAQLNPPTRTPYYDSIVPGLVLRVSAPHRRHGRRARTWYFVYRDGGPQHWIPLGSYPATEVIEARVRAKAARRRLEDGFDPASERRPPLPPPPAPPAPAATTEPPPLVPGSFGAFVPIFLAFQKGRIKDLKNEQQKIARYLLPAWRDRPLKSLTRADVHERLDALTVKGLTLGVNRIQALMSRIFTIALDRGLIDSHPAARVIKRFPDNPRDRVLTDVELRTLWAGLEAHPGAASDAIKLRALLGQRGGETAGMAWAELDLEAAVWNLPRPRTKNKLPHVVALPPRSLAILTARRAHVAADEPRVFPGLKLSGDDHKDLRAIHGGAYEWIDLRRTMATRLGDLGFDDPIIGRVLNHKAATVTRKHYNHARYLAEIRAVLEAWDEALGRILAGQPMKDTGRVLPMRPRGLEA